MSEKNNSIQMFEDRQIRTAWNAEQEEWYFSVTDVIAVLTDSADPKQYIKKMRSRDSELDARWGTICTLTSMVASDGKKYRTNAATMEGIFRIIQSVTSPKVEPLKAWLAKVGSERVPVPRHLLLHRTGHRQVRLSDAGVGFLSGLPEAQQ